MLRFHPRDFLCIFKCFVVGSLLVFTTFKGSPAGAEAIFSDDALYAEAEATFGLSMLEQMFPPPDQLTFECGGSAVVEVEVAEHSKVVAQGKEGYIACKYREPLPGEAEKFCANAENHPAIEDAQKSSFSEDAQKKCDNELKTKVGALGITCNRPPTPQCRLGSCTPYPDTRQLVCPKAGDPRVEHTAKILGVTEHHCRVACEAKLIRSAFKHDVRIGCSSCE